MAGLGRDSRADIAALGAPVRPADRGYRGADAAPRTQAGADRLRRCRTCAAAAVGRPDRSGRRLVAEIG